MEIDTNKVTVELRAAGVYEANHPGAVRLHVFVTEGCLVTALSHQLPDNVQEEEILKGPDLFSTRLAVAAEAQKLWQSIPERQMAQAIRAQEYVIGMPGLNSLEDLMRAFVEGADSNRLSSADQELVEQAKRMVFKHQEDASHASSPSMGLADRNAAELIGGLIEIIQR